MVYTIPSHQACAATLYGLLMAVPTSTGLPGGAGGRRGQAGSVRERGRSAAQRCWAGVPGGPAPHLPGSHAAACRRGACPQRRPSAAQCSAGGLAGLPGCMARRMRGRCAHPLFTHTSMFRALCSVGLGMTCSAAHASCHKRQGQTPHAGAACLADAAQHVPDAIAEAALARGEGALKCAEPAPRELRWAPKLCALSLLPLASLGGLPTVVCGAAGRPCLAICAQLWLHRVSAAWPDLP